MSAAAGAIKAIGALKSAGVGGKVNTDASQPQGAEGDGVFVAAPAERRGSWSAALEKLPGQEGFGGWAQKKYVDPLVGKMGLLNFRDDGAYRNPNSPLNFGAKGPWRR